MTARLRGEVEYLQQACEDFKEAQAAWEARRRQLERRNIELQQLVNELGAKEEAGKEGNDGSNLEEVSCDVGW